MPRKRTEEEVAELLRRYDDPGNVTRRAFCQSYGVAVSTQGYDMRRQTTPSVRLARVKIASDSASGEDDSNWCLQIDDASSADSRSCGI